MLKEFKLKVIQDCKHAATKNQWSFSDAVAAWQGASKSGAFGLADHEQQEIIDFAEYLENDAKCHTYSIINGEGFSLMDIRSPLTKLSADQWAEQFISPVMPALQNLSNDAAINPHNSKVYYLIISE